MTTRRDILKGGAGLAAILATGKAPAYLVKSMLAARNGIMAAKRGGGWVNPYVTDGLVAMYDGIGNIGWEKHDASSDEWIDLCGNSNLSLDERYVTWNDDGLTISDCPVNDSSSFAAQASGNISYDVKTIEICGLLPREIMKNGSYLFTGYKERGIGGFAGGWISPAVNLTFSYNCKFFGSGLYDGYYSYNGTWSFVYNTDIDNLDVDAYKRGTIFTGTTTPYRALSYASFTNVTIRFYYETKIRSLRIYSRALTAAEIAANYAIDKERFNLT